MCGRADSRHPDGVKAGVEVLVEPSAAKGWGSGVASEVAVSEAVLPGSLAMSMTSLGLAREGSCAADWGGSSVEWQVVTAGAALTPSLWVGATGAASGSTEWKEPSFFLRALVSSS